MSNLPDLRPARNDSAVSIFLAGLPDIRRGRIVTAGSTIDSWKAKPRAILERLRGERLAHAWRAAL